MVTQESFGSFVRRYRRNADLSQETLAERAGLSIRVSPKLSAWPRWPALKGTPTHRSLPRQLGATFCVVWAGSRKRCRC